MLKTIYWNLDFKKCEVLSKTKHCVFFVIHRGSIVTRYELLISLVLDFAPTEQSIQDIELLYRLVHVLLLYIILLWKMQMDNNSSVFTNILNGTFYYTREERFLLFFVWLLLYFGLRKSWVLTKVLEKVMVWGSLKHSLQFYILKKHFQ